MKIAMSVLIFMCSFLKAQAKETCAPLPENLTLSGSTFSEYLNISTKRKCGFGMTITSRMEQALIKAQGAEKDKEMQDWKSKNPTDYSSAKWEKDNLDFRTYISNKYPALQQKIRHQVNSQQGKICLFATSKCESNSVELQEGGKVYGILETSPQGTFVFSVNNGGKKDLSKPYLHISPLKKGTETLPASASIVAMENGATIGRMEVDAEDSTHCAKGSDKIESALDLRGKVSVFNGEDCKDALSIKSYVKPSNISGSEVSSDSNR